MVGDLSELILDRPCSPFSVTTDVFAPLAEWSGCEGAGIFSNAWNQEAARLCQRRGFSCRPGTGTERPGRPQICPECAHSPARACGFWRVSESPASRPPALPSGSSGQPAIRRRNTPRRLFTLAELRVKPRWPCEDPSGAAGPRSSPQRGASRSPGPHVPQWPPGGWWPLGFCCCFQGHRRGGGNRASYDATKLAEFTEGHSFSLNKCFLLP